MVIVFVSGIKDYVFQAFDVAAFHDLIKPLEKEKFEEVLDRALREAEKHRRRAAVIIRNGERMPWKCTLP